MRTSERTRSAKSSCEQPRERAGGGDADQVRGWDAIGVEHAGGVGNQVIHGVLGASGLVGDGSAGVAAAVMSNGNQRAATRPRVAASLLCRVSATPAIPPGYSAPQGRHAALEAKPLHPTVVGRGKNDCRSDVPV
jgi:hypothetical protein